jgi:hypothetical protein
VSRRLIGMRLKLLLLAVLSLLTAGCASDSSAPATTTETSATATTQTTEPATTTTTADPTATTSPDFTDFDGPSALGLWWTVVGVEFDDTLNVREEPDARSQIVDELDPWATDFIVTELAEQTNNGVWRQVKTEAGVAGWVNARFLVGQPEFLTTVEQASLVSQTENLISWSLGDSADRQFQLADPALWVAGVGIWADGPIPWTWISANDLETVAQWEEVRTFDPSWDGFDCGSDCDMPLVDFLRFELVKEEAEAVVNDIPDGNNNGFLEGMMWQAPKALHRTVMVSPAASDLELDWQRIHFVFDWSHDDPQVAMIHTHSWTP